MSIDDTARRWAIRLDAGGLSADDEAALDAWLDGDDRRQGALLRAQAILSYFDRSRALAGGTGPAPGAPAVDPSNDDDEMAAPHFSRRRVLAFGAAAGVAALGAGLWGAWPRGQRIETALGEIRSVPLADGSLATINTQSRVAVRMEAERRTVRLDDGEVWFKVAHDPNRPFIVEAGEVRVRAVGTAFAVRRDNGGAEVLVTEGVVETWIVGREGEARRIGAGAMAYVEPAAPEIRSVAAAPEIERALSWRSGELAFDGETLGQAVAQFNRYNEMKLIVDDPALMREPVVGYFSANEPEEFARAFGKLVDAKVAMKGGVIRLEKLPR
jgi:transmembrane sensor